MSAEILHFFRVIDAPNRLRELRQAIGWSQQRLADAIGVSKVTISDLERGSMQMTVDYMRRLAIPLGCTPAELLAPTDNPYLLSEDERAIIDRLRAGEAHQREQLRQLADVVIPFKPQEQDQLTWSKG